MDVFFEIHRGLVREAPGSDACTARALALVPGLPERPQILDVGCGPGAQTLVLAKETRGAITAIDTHQPFLDELRRRAERDQVTTHISTRNMSMFALECEDASLDLIWSEGAIYIMGFRQGLEAWRRFLKPGGALVVTELSWLTKTPPDPPRRFWETAYPALQHIDDNLTTLQEAGYRAIDHFVLPTAAWWDDYYTPIERRIHTLRQRHHDNPEALAVLDQEQQEIDLYRDYASCYGYVFYIMEVIG